MPRSVHRFIGSVIGILWFDVLRIRRALTLANIRLAYPDWPEERVIRTARESMCIVGQGIVDVVIIPFINQTWVDQNVEFRGLENYKLAHQDTGISFLSLHLASGDLAVAAMSIRGFPIHLITKEFKSAWLNNFWFSSRKKHGTRYISDRKSSFEILRALKKKGDCYFCPGPIYGPADWSRGTVLWL